MPNAPPETSLAWDSNDTPRSKRFGDTYFSAEDGLAETRHVFLAGNRLPDAWAGRAHFHIAELGFGSGLNVLAVRELWQRTRAPGAVLTVTSFERYPLSTAQMTRALARWPEIAPLAAELTAIWTPEGGEFDFGDTLLRVMISDARAELPSWRGTADAWFLDGFAPARNAEMWEPGLLRAVFERTARGGTAATFTAAGEVRRSLAGAGFLVEKRPGFGPKRDMTVARHP
ncbi:MAG: tRNA (5-methylaminomethyl-2-thiouridine)(34)-methyltransferase MnmD [Paracoccaceae bacterium]|nr:tRNA (5-methylaminomethyl-2-thiouridine)(34)-methyltransferase MnmD [Paracoccaceae bacterium]